MFDLPENAVLLIDGAAGIYIPQKFANNYSVSIEGCDNEDLEIIKQGPDHPFYWDAWDCVLQNARLYDEKGNAYFLYQDGDLWAIPIEG